MAESMTDTSGEMSPLQAKTFDRVPIRWTPIPRIGVHEAILRALKDRCLVETRYADGGVRQWRRTPRLTDREAILRAMEGQGSAIVCYRRPRPR